MGKRALAIPSEKEHKDVHLGVGTQGGAQWRGGNQKIPPLELGGGAQILKCKASSNMIYEKGDLKDNANIAFCCVLYLFTFLENGISQALFQTDTRCGSFTPPPPTGPCGVLAQGVQGRSWQLGASSASLSCDLEL